ncbi:hypothetical protein AB0L49_50930, partial [Streptomyces antimycoticus]|uniref:hypothetical protein n=1 Tax=Streptomyces antimycoticus TaxID=68175 RepID=UPI0034424F5B
GVTAAGLAYYAPADTANTAFGHAMAYEAAVFLLTALIALPLRQTTSPTRSLPPPSGTRSPRA